MFRIQAVVGIGVHWFLRIREFGPAAPALCVCVGFKTIETLEPSNIISIPFTKFHNISQLGRSDSWRCAKGNGFLYQQGRFQFAQQNERRCHLGTKVTTRKVSQKNTKEFAVMTWPLQLSLLIPGYPSHSLPLHCHASREFRETQIRTLSLELSHTCPYMS